MRFAKNWLLYCAALWMGACGSSGGSSSAQTDDAGARDDAGSGGSGAPTGPLTNTIMGRLGDLGVAKAPASAKVITNSGETLVYMTSAPLTCEPLKVSRWLGAFASGAQVVEIVIHGPATVGPIEGAEVNYAPGGKSSAYEKNAKSTMVTITKSEPMGVVEGTFWARYDSPPSIVKGTFHAGFCANGQDY